MNTLANQLSDLAKQPPTVKGGIREEASCLSSSGSWFSPQLKKNPLERISSCLT